MFSRTTALAVTQAAGIFPTDHGVFRPGVGVPADLRIVCLWTTLGLALTALLFGLGFGAEIGQALTAAG